MTYEELLRRLAKFGIAQIGRLQKEGQEIAILAKTDEVTFPFAFNCSLLHLPKGNTSDIDPYVVATVLRNFGISESDFNPVN